MLRVTINEGVYGYNGVRKSFGDGKTQRIEDLMNYIFEALATWSAAIKAERQEQALRQQRWEKEERRREEHRRRKALELKRADALARDLKRWRKSQEILQLVAAVETKLVGNAATEPEESRQWIEWEKCYAARLTLLARTCRVC